MSSFLGSERSGASLHIYSFAKRGLAFYSQGEGLGLATRTDLVGGGSDEGLELVSLSTATSLGAGSGWQAVVKYPASFDPLTEIEMGSWVHVSVVRNGVPYLLVTGIITDRNIQEASSGGVTTRMLALSGGGFELIYKYTRWWFNVLNKNGPENIGNSEVLRAIGIEYLLADPATNVRNILQKFLSVIAGRHRAPFQFPDTMPGVSGSAVDAIKFDASGYDNKTLPLIQPVASANYPNVDLWSLAQEYQDGMFTEFWADVLPAGGLKSYAADPNLAAGLTPRSSQMTLAFRTKPFPLSSSGLGSARGLASAYFSLPTHTVRRADIAALSLGGSEDEKFNAFSFSNMGGQEAARQFIELQYCEWDTSDQDTYGLRKLDFTSMYFNNNLALQADYNRKRMRDWYCLNTSMFSGSVQMGRGWPQIKVGSRLVITGPGTQDRMTLYVESVRHSWSAGGLVTSLEVTRGYKGTDADFLRRLDAKTLDFSKSY